MKLCWLWGRVAKKPRGTLEVQAITAGDVCFLLRAVWFELQGGEVTRQDSESNLRGCTERALITDSRQQGDLRRHDEEPQLPA